MSHQCLHCPRRLISTAVWRRHTPAERAAAKRQGLHRDQARGLCSKCYQRARKQGWLADIAPRIRPSEETLAEYELLADPERSIRKNVELIAPRMGMKPRSLERAVNRRNVKAR